MTVKCILKKECAAVAWIAWAQDRHHRRSYGHKPSVPTSCTEFLPFTKATGRSRTNSEDEDSRHSIICVFFYSPPACWPKASVQSARRQQGLSEGYHYHHPCEQSQTIVGDVEKQAGKVTKSSRKAQTVSNYWTCLLQPLRYFFFGRGGEGPRSRCCGRTAALRLIVQPCDEDDQFFFRFSL